MKKHIASTAFLLAAVVALSGCANKNESSAASQTAEPVTEASTSAAPADTTSSETETEAPEDTTAPAADTEETTALEASTCPYDFDFDITLVDGSTKKFSEGDEWTEYGVFYNDFALARYTTGTTYDSATNPEMFDVANYGFTGDMYTLNPEWFEVRVGDTFCDGALTVTEVQTAYQYMYDTETNAVGYTEIMANDITFDGTITLKGRCVCAQTEDVYIAVGDVTFTPFVDSIASFPMNGSYIGTTSWAADMSDAWVLDSFSENIGSVVENSMLDEYLDNGETKNLEITFSNIQLTYSEQRGFHFNATIDSVSEYIF